MKRCVTAGVALFAAACAGCGTVRNFVDFPDDTGERTNPYGGVKLAVDGIKNEHDVGLTYTWPFRLADVTLSAVGDTLTLPLTLPIACAHAINDGIREYYFPKEKPPEPPGGRDGRASGDTPDPLTASGRTVAR